MRLGNLSALIALCVLIGACATTKDPDITPHDTWTDPGTDWVVDPSWDTSADTVYDSLADILPDTTEETTVDVSEDTLPDTVIDTAPDTAIDTVIDTAPDTAVDTVIDTAPDTAIDTVIDTWPDTLPDTAVDTITDTGIDEIPTGPGTTCADPIDVTGLTSWTGDLGMYGNLWIGASGCPGASGREIWFEASVPANFTFTISEITTTNVAIEFVSSCLLATCSAYALSPETLSWFNGTGSTATILVAVEGEYAATTGAVGLDIGLSPAPEGYTCSSAVDVSSLSSWTGSFTDYGNLWSRGTGCLSASGPEAWFQATVPAGNRFSLAEVSSSDVVVHVLTSCSATSCSMSRDTPESVEYINSSGSPVTLWFVVEGYYAGSAGPIDLDFTNAPPPEGSSCTNPVDVTSVTSWSGTFTDYRDSWDGGTGCGYASGAEVWFMATVEDGHVFSITETTGTDVVLHRIGTCPSTTCTAYSDEPEKLEYFNTTGAPLTLFVVVERYSTGATGSVAVTVTNGPPPAGTTCSGAVDVSASGTWTGSFVDYRDLWDGTTGCGYASGPELWFFATIPAGNLLTFEETSSTDVVLQILTACPATTCMDYTDTPEGLELLNNTGGSTTLWIAVEKYYSGSTGSWAVETGNAPAPDGYWCGSAVDVTSLGSWSGNYSSFADLWDPPSGCGYSTGHEVWLSAEVLPGYTLTVQETSFTDVVLAALSSCSATSCLSYKDSPETITVTNSTASTQTYLVVVDCYSCTTGSIALTITNAP